MIGVKESIMCGVTTSATFTVNVAVQSKYNEAFFFFLWENQAKPCYVCWTRFKIEWGRHGL